MWVVKEPNWRISQLATFELRDYRERLESAIAEIPAKLTADRVTLESRLSEVITEQETRAEAELASRKRESSRVAMHG